MRYQNTARVLWVLKQLDSDDFNEAEVKEFSMSGGNLEELLSLFMEKDPFLSAARILKLSSRGNQYSEKISYIEAFTLAVYRLYEKGIRLMATGGEIKKLAEKIDAGGLTEISDWLRKRSLVVHSKAQYGSRERTAAFRFRLPGFIKTVKTGDEPAVLRINREECRLVYSDQNITASNIISDDPLLKPFWIPSNPSGFEDLSLTRNRDLFQKMIPGVHFKSGFLKWPALASMNSDRSRKLKDLEPDQRFIFYLGLVSLLDVGPVLIIDKPCLGSRCEFAFWNQISALLQSGKACLLISRDPSSISQCHSVSVVRDGSFLGTLSKEEIKEADDFLWIKCRVIDPSLTSSLPSHYLKVTPVSGEIWFAARPGNEDNDYYLSVLRNKYGLALIPGKFVHPTLEERMIKLLKDESLTGGGII